MINVLVVGLYIGEGTIGGIVHFNRLLLEYLVDEKINMSFFSMGKSPNWYHGKDKPTIFRYHILHLKKMFDIIFEIKKKKIDIVHINSNLAFRSLFRDGVFSLLARIICCKTCFFIHGWDFDEFEKIINSNIKKKLLSMLLEKQNIIGVSANQFKKGLISLGVKPENIFLFSTMVEKEKYYPKLKNEERPYKIIFCANPLRKEKGIYELLHAIPLIVKAHQDIEFIIIGGGEILHELTEESKRLNICEHIRFAGYISTEEKINIFQSSHILIFPSYTEGFPSTILEAMAAGLPIVATPVGGIADALRDGENGYIINSMPPKPNEIASKTIRLLKNPELVKKMSLRNLKDIKDKYDVEIVTSFIGKVYETVYRESQ